MSTYARLKKAGIEPQFSINHGMTTSLYYPDPDKNMVELQVLGYFWQSGNLCRVNDFWVILQERTKVSAP